MTDDSPVDFGTHLRLAREKRGLTLQQIAATTKISARVLASLERNDVSILPGGIFSRAFVRSYAKEIGLNPEATVEMFAESFPGEMAPEAAPVASSEDPEDFESGRQVATTMLRLVGLSVLVVAAVLVYFNLRGSSKPAVQTDLQRPAPARSAEPTPPPIAKPSDAVAPGLADRAAAPATPASSPADTPPAASPVQNPVAAPAQTETAAPVRIALVAKAPCWVSMTVDGTRVVARVLQAGERLSYAAQSAIDLNLGDAGAVSMMLNDVAARPLGLAGSVVSTRITPDNYRALLARQ